MRAQRGALEKRVDLGWDSRGIASLQVERIGVRTMTKTDRSIIGATAGLLVSSLACRPVIAVGWSEMVILAIIVAIVISPLVFRILRLLAKIEKAKERESEEEGE